MGENLEEKIYQYGDSFYTFEEICELFVHTGFEKKQKFKDCLAHFLLAQILRKGGFSKYADIIDDLGRLEKSGIDKNLSKVEEFFHRNEYSLKVKRLFGLSGIINKYKISEFVNGEWLLKKLVSSTIGSSYDVLEQDDFSLINIDGLTDEECHAISDNFQRNMRNEELVFYKSKRLEKERKPL